MFPAAMAVSVASNAMAGVLRIDLDRSLEDGAQRVATERLNRRLPNLAQVAAVGGANRDPRAPWAMSVVYRSLVQPDIETSPGKRVQALEWRSVAKVVAANDLAFDHATLVSQAAESVRQPGSPGRAQHTP